MLLMLDNYDSFTFNLVQYFEELGASVDVLRNDQIPVQHIVDLEPAHFVVSPGPCTPNEAGISVEAIKACACLLYTSPSPRDGLLSRMPSSA